MFFALLHLLKVCIYNINCFNSYYSFIVFIQSENYIQCALATSKLKQICGAQNNLNCFFSSVFFHLGSSSNS